MKKYRSKIITFFAVITMAATLTSCGSLFNKFSKTNSSLSLSQSVEEAELKKLSEKTMESEPNVNENERLISFDNPDYEWSQFDTKEAKAILKGNGLLIESSKSDRIVLSVAEFPVDLDNPEFSYKVIFTSANLGDNKYVGLVFDYLNDRNYKAVMVDKKTFIYFTVEKGETSIVKQGLVKSGKFASLISISLQGQKMEIKLNDLEVSTINRVQITSPILGVMISGKMKAFCSGFYFAVPEPNENIEQSTTDI